jgi:Icc-related predicted phosphoesterase
MADSHPTVRLAAFADIHYAKNLAGSFNTLFAELAGAADVVAVCGDLTSHGHLEEASLFAHDITAVVRVPILVVLGNHDYEAGQQEAIRELLTNAGIIVLDGEAEEIHGIGFAGVKGFCGGFGRCVLEPWGEQTIKRFVREVVDETLRLESALARLRTQQKVVLMHYSPIRQTVEGEPLEIFPYLGCSRLEEPINRYEASMVFHGHAHHGSPEGHTLTNVPVYNVAMPVLQRVAPDRPPFRVVDLASADEAESRQL